jgi:choline dehydrogenase-like flavoprotein
MHANEHDVIVVGAGASGIVTAARLAERGVDVLLLEAGEDWRAEGLDDSLRRPFHSFAWTVNSVPPGHLWQGLTARRREGVDETLFLRGRGVGGSTLINGLIALRPPLSEFAHWRAVGGTSWTRDAVLDAFRRVETDHDYGDSPLHGSDGPLPVTRIMPDGWGTVDQLFTTAVAEQGHKWIGDLNGEGEDGIGHAPAAIVNGRRVTVADAYLGRPGKPSPALLDQCTVDKLDISNGRVVGVRVIRNGEKQTLRAQRVVLAAGAVMTGAILQRSGIGPAEVLAKAGIDQVLDLPVGQRLQEHAGLKFAMHLEGPALPAENDNRGNILVRYSSGHADYGEGDLVMGATNVSGREPLPAPELLSKLCQCHSIGSLAIRSADPEEYPDLNLGLLSDPRDLLLARRSYKDLFDVTRSRALAGRVAAVTSMAGEALPDRQDDQAIDAWLRSNVMETAHVCGTAPLGREGDGVSVVNDQALVHGVENLWIGDLSITPTVPRANTQLTAMMIGERIADFLTSA